MLSRNSRGSAREPAEHHVVKQGTANFTKSSKDSNQLKKLNEYTIQRKLGQGAYGQVFMASDERGETVAIKVINKSVLKRKSMGARGASALDTLAREIAVMKKINHPHCVQLYEVIDDPKDEKLYLVMELLTGGEAMHKDNLPPEQEHLPENAARQVFRDLLVGLEYLHAQGILHRDLKPENLVFQAAPDYGRARSASTSGRGSPRTFFLRNSSARASSARASSSRDSTSSRDSSSSRPSSASRPSLRGLASLAPWRRASTSHHGASTSTKLQHAEAEAPWCEVVQEVGAGRGSGGGTGHGSGHGARDGQTGEASLQATLPGGILHAHGAGGEFSGVAPAEGGRPAAAARRRWSLCGGRRDRGGGGAGEAGVAAADPSLVRHAPRIKLLDFGVAAICREHEALEALEVAGGSGTPCTQPDARRDGVPAVRQDDSLLKTSGTPAFYAPEMCVKGAYHGRAADVWAAGVTLCMLAGGKLPFEADNMPEVFRMIKEEEPALPPHASAALQQLLRRMLAKRPERRPSLQELRVDPWVTAGGTHPLPQQECGEVVPTETEVHDAIKELGVSLKVVVAAKKWRGAALKSRAAVSLMHTGAEVAASDAEAAKQAGTEAEQAVAASAFAGVGVVARARAGAQEQVQEQERRHAQLRK